MFTSVLHASVAATEREQALDTSRRGQAMTALPDKLGALTAATRVFGEQRVPYALIGGLAVGIRSGVPRATLDVDFAVPTTVESAHLIEALSVCGFRFTGQYPHSLNFVHESGEPVQIAFDAEFDAMIARAELVQQGELAIVVVTREDLIAMKRRAAADPTRRRSKALRDAADIALLEGDVPGDDDGW
jgi:predicted nucleotidyltransferase